MFNTVVQTQLVKKTDQKTFLQNKSATEKIIMHMRTSCLWFL